MRGEPLGEVDRAVLAAGAADGHGQIAAVGAHQRAASAREIAHVLWNRSTSGCCVEELARPLRRARSGRARPGPSTDSASRARRTRSRRRPARHDDTRTTGTAATGPIAARSTTRSRISSRNSCTDRREVSMVRSAALAIGASRRCSCSSASLQAETVPAQRMATPRLAETFQQRFLVGAQEQDFAGDAALAARRPAAAPRPGPRGGCARRRRPPCCR